ncbi:hypothetical protein VTN77DRAFT_9873 [Rasamsonia byssochlamydoides]|uniref:uncharacterized protein n=1 Tax=Rasamsonia byssochlamydoides TaxID=89139 RepID=UPI003743D88F
MFYRELTFLTMTRLRGQMLNRSFHRLSYREREQLAEDLKMVVEQLRRIPNFTPYRFASTIGGPLVDHRLPDGRCGPFNQESDFNNHLVHKYVGSTTREAIAPVHSRQHRSFFTHADLHPTHILIDGGRLSGIVDGECAGYFPAYWEFTKAIFGVENDEPKEKTMRAAFGGDDFEDELKAEKLLWRETLFGL